ncbi:hypothetical protein [Streptomyces sp. t39]|uniref:DUF7848 domain-containing protein n=1 Tax=Streptomyces sp. t39 TaxID=1828156 RepID=UPI0011CE55A4|nr:hypothetical protein [Streptomyces sp. t39]TXS35266.1 hypothetical protein EAO77_37245 [Streptomyces sp. t39]
MRFRFTALTTQDGHPPVYSTVCAKCHEASVGYSTSEHAKSWTIEHAKETHAKGSGHTVFRMVIESYAVVRPASPAN